MALRLKTNTTIKLIVIIFIAIWAVVTIVILSLPEQTNYTHNLSFNTQKMQYSAFDNISPLWSKQNRDIAWTKFMNGTGTMILIHARKAAGTSMDKWMTHLIKEAIPYWKAKIENNTWKCDLIRFEAFTNIHDKHKNNNFIDDIIKKYRFGIYVMSLREPISRIVSQYEFEWRWGCIRCGPQRTFMKYNKLTQMNKTNYMQKVDHKLRINIFDKKWKYCNIDFTNFLDRIERFELKSTDIPRDGSHVRSFGTYINNYYLWMFCCHSKFCNLYKDFDDELINECYYKAIQRIISFDIVIISEWLNDIRIQLYVNKLLFRQMFTQEMFVPLISYPYPHRIVDRGTNYMISEGDRDKLLKWNQWDIKLYEFTKRLLYHRQNL